MVALKEHPCRRAFLLALAVVALGGSGCGGRTPSADEPLVDVYISTPTGSFEVSPAMLRVLEETAERLRARRLVPFLFD